MEKSLSDVIRDMNHSTTVVAQSWYADKKKISVILVLLRMNQRFLVMYFVKGGFRRGFHGFRDAVNHALFELLCYAKYWELNERQKGRM